MRKLSLLTICIITLAITGCHKPNDTTTTTATEQEVLTSFAQTLANPNYQDIQAKAGILQSSVTTLLASPTDANLAAAQTAWRNTRATWESCEGYLFGPVEYDNYDPSMDTWPLDRGELDSLLGSGNPLNTSDIDALPESLKGFHAIEYVLFGVGGTKTAAQIDANARQKKYLASLTESLYNTTTALRNSWDPAVGNFTDKLVNAGTTNRTYFATRHAAFLAIVGAMAGICEEVGTGKMEDPLTGNNGQADSTQCESSFSHNSTTDFKNNITGILNAYTCKYNGVTGKSLHDFVAGKNLSLDNTVTSQINAAIASFDPISLRYEDAVYNQVVQIHNAQAAIDALHTTLDGQLRDFIIANVRD